MILRISKKRKYDSVVKARLVTLFIFLEIQNFPHPFYPSSFHFQIHTPKLIGGASEGGANVFKLNYFDQVRGKN